MGASVEISSLSDRLDLYFQSHPGASILRECIEHFSIQHTLLYIQGLCDFILRYPTQFELLSAKHPETIFVLDAIYEVYQWFVIPHLNDSNEQNLLFNPVFMQSIFSRISALLYTRLEELSGIDSSFIIALSAECYERASANNNFLAIVPSEVSISQIPNCIAFDKDSRIRLQRENLHAVRKQLQLAKEGALAVSRVSGSNSMFETVGLLPADIALQYPRFGFSSHMDWSFCIPDPPLQTGSPETTKEEKGKVDLFSGTRLRHLHGIPMIPPVPLKDEILEISKQVFNSDSKASAITSIIQGTTSCKKGAILFFAESEIIQSEANWLVKQSKRGILLDSPVPLASGNSQLLERLCNVDGALLLDSDGCCHAFGVILDGEIDRKTRSTSASTPPNSHCKGDPARGSRFNSSLLYSVSLVSRNDKKYQNLPFLCAVRSEDGMLDLIDQDYIRSAVSKTYKVHKKLT